MTISPTSLWTPQTLFSNPSQISSHANHNVDITNDGTCKQYQSIVFSVAKDFNITDYPYDSQSLKIITGLYP